MAMLPVAALALAALAACTHAPQLARFEQALAAQPSATAALGEWCAAQAIASTPAIRATPVRGSDALPAPDLRRLLAVSDGERLGYRHVRLSCGDAVLSQAHNWYVPARLTPQMNATLDSSDTPFGRVVAPLGFHRERLDSVRGRAAGCPPGTILSHRALLRLPDGRPISLVVECYTRANLRD